jgi:hypothetical protein
MKELIGDVLFQIGAVIFFWIIFCLILNVIHMSTGIRDRIALHFKIPKQKKYLTKVDPIYEMCHDNWDRGYKVKKWSLTYEEPENLAVWCFIFIPYPIVFETFKYRVEDSYFLCNMDEVNLLDPDVPLEITYNEKHERWLLKDAEEKRLKDIKKNIIKSKNKIFKENYE